MSDGKTIESVMEEVRRFPPPKEFSEKAHIKSMEQYEKMYQDSIKDPEGFWAKMASEELHWFSKWNRVHSWNKDNAEIKWFEGGKLNVSYNCLDRHVENGRKNKAAIIWQGEGEEEVRVLTYQQLQVEVCRFSNVLKSMGVEKGDRISIYMPMIPELAIAMLACTRLGAVHSIVFGGFSSASLKDR
ncbi:MAG: acetyl-coenzyme A synthetase, partial [Methanomassiliicoccus sp.]